MVGVDNLRREWVRGGGDARFDTDVVIEIQGESKGIESRAEVGGGGRYTNPEGGLERFHKGGSRKNFSAAEVVSRAISASGRPRREAIFWATNRV